MEQISNSTRTPNLLVETSLHIAGIHLGLLSDIDL